MLDINIYAAVISDEDSNIIGFSVAGRGDDVTRFFCLTFPKDLLEYHAEIRFKEDKIVLDCLDGEFNGIAEVPMDEFSIKKLKELFASHSISEMKLEASGENGGGFRIYLDRQALTCEEAMKAIEAASAGMMPMPHVAVNMKKHLKWCVKCKKVHLKRSEDAEKIIAALKVFQD